MQSSGCLLVIKKGRRCWRVSAPGQEAGSALSLPVIHLSLFPSPSLCIVVVDFLSGLLLIFWIELPYQVFMLQYPCF